MLNYENLFKIGYKDIIEVDKKDITPYIKYHFIKYFEVEDDELIIYFSNITISTSYDKEIELQILEKMKEQISIYKNKNYDIDKTDYFSPSIWLLNGSLQGILTLINNDNLPILHFITMVLSLINAGLYSQPIITKKIIKHDIQKHLLFLENEDKINEKINEEMLSLRIVDEEAINLVPLFDSHLTINDIHFMNKRQLQELIDGNIDEETIYRLRKN